MHCRRVQKLIPLHVDSDLPAGAANRVASHLEWCGACNWLADEYKESQGWLRSHTPPEFDEAALNDFKHGVMNRVAARNAGPSLVASLAQHWTRRPLMALAAGLLIVLGMVALYIYQARAKINTSVIAQEAKPPPSNEHASPPTIGPEAAPGATLGGLSVSQNISHRLRVRDRRQNLTSHAVERTVAAHSNGITEPVAAIEQRLSSDNANASKDVSQDKLRIEIQTGDPNIRIIWFAPKETDSHQNKPATD